MLNTDGEMSFCGFSGGSRTAYSAPEVVKQLVSTLNIPESADADLWSVGVTLFIYDCKKLAL